MTRKSNISSISIENIESIFITKDFKKYKFFFRADGNNDIGLGHLKRIKTIIEYLWKQYSNKSVLITTTVEMVSSIGKWEGLSEIISLINIYSLESEVEMIKSIFKNFNHSYILILDLRDPIPEFYGKILYEDHIKFITIGNTGIGTYFSQCIIIGNPHEEFFWKPLQNKLLTIKERPILYDGIDFIIIDPHYWKFRVRKDKIIQKKHNISRKYNILISYGGSDKGESSLSTIKALYSKKELFQTISVVIGPAFNNIQLLKKEIDSQYPEVHIFYNPPSLAKLLFQADFAFVSFGTTLYEALYLGVICLILNPTPYHLYIAEKFCSQENAAINLGLAQNFNYDNIWNHLEPLLKNSAGLINIKRLVTKNIDGNGLQRIIKIINSLINE